MNKIKILIITLCLSTFLFSPLHAQESEVYDVLELHDGNKVQGKILELKEEEYVLIKVSETGKTEKYLLEDIDRIMQMDANVLASEKDRKKTSKERIKPTYEFEEQGGFTTLNFGFSFGKRERTITQFDPFPFEESSQTAIGFNVQTIVGYQFNRHFGLGAGASYDAYNLEDAESIFTLLAHCRGYLSKKIISPYWALNAGYGFAFKNPNEGVEEAKGGLMVHPELGFRLGASEKTNFTISLGYRFQSAEYVQEFPFNGDIEYRKINYRRFLFSVGLLF